MSDSVSYMSEPLTSGKVLLHTTIGDFDIELFSQQTPHACRSFIQHCLDGYYDGCIFHRVIKGFMAQTGDPTGTGRGGRAAILEGGDPDKETFPDEFHSRLRFNRRGLVGMASSGGKDTNRSQFFITLDKCEFLTKKHTLFGKLTGQTLFNIMKFNELEIENIGKDGEVGEQFDRPFNPPKILSAEILNNPWPEMKSRKVSKEELEKMKERSENASTSRPKKKQKKEKNLRLLSFGEEEQLEASAISQIDASRTTATAGGGTSMHDLVDDDIRLSKKSVEEVTKEVEEAKRSAVKEEEDETMEHEDSDKLRQSVRDALSSKKKSSAASASSTAATLASSSSRTHASSSTVNTDLIDEDSMDEATYDAYMRRKISGKAAPPVRIPDAAPSSGRGADVSSSKDAKAEYERMKADLGLSRSKPTSSSTAAASSSSSATTTNPLLLSRKQYKSRKEIAAAAQDREQTTLEKLAAFQAQLKKASTGATETKKPSFETIPKHSTVEIPPVPLRDDTIPSDVSDSWLSHSLQFSRRPQDFDPMARDTDSGFSFSVVDPRGEEGEKDDGDRKGRGGRDGSSSSRHHGSSSSRRDHKHSSSTRPPTSGERGMTGLHVPRRSHDEEEKLKTFAEREEEERNQRVVERLLKETESSTATASSSSSSDHKRKRSDSPD